MIWFADKNGVPLLQVVLFVGILNGSRKGENVGTKIGSV